MSAPSGLSNGGPAALAAAALLIAAAALSARAQDAAAAAPSASSSAPLSVSSPADASPAAALHRHALAATCAACHGTDGRAPAGSAMPSLAGRPAPWLVAQMQAFKSGERPATVMHQIARGYSEAQIAQIAAFFAAQRP